MGEDGDIGKTPVRKLSSVTILPSSGGQGGLKKGQHRGKPRVGMFSVYWFCDSSRLRSCRASIHRLSCVTHKKPPFLYLRVCVYRIWKFLVHQ